MKSWSNFNYVLSLLDKLNNKSIYDMDQFIQKQNLEKKEEIKRPGIREEKEEGEVGERTERVELERAREDLRREKIETEEMRQKEILFTQPVVIKPPRKSQTQKEIENILEEKLGEIYQSMDSIRQKEFKEKGEEAAFKISILINQAKIKIREILKLIIEWLKLIPGINRFFLEQEAKIKTDKILRLKKLKE